MTPEKLSVYLEIDTITCDDCYKLNNDCNPPCSVQILKLFNSEVVEDDPAGIELAMDMGEKITEEQYNEYVKFIESR